MGNLLTNGVKIIIALIIISIVFSLIGNLFSLAIKLAIFGGIGYGCYIGAKKVGLLK